MKLRTLLQLVLFFWLCSGGHAINAKEATKTLSMSLYNKLTVIENMMAQQEYAKAQKKLNTLLGNLPDSATDKAYIYHTQGTLNLYQEQYQEAEKYYLLAYQLDALNEKTTASVVQTLANLSMHYGKYRQAVNYLEEYLDLAEAPTKQIYLALGTAYYQIKEYTKALKPLQEAMTKFEPDKSVHLILFSVYYELHQLDKAALVLEKVILLWPEEGQYWLQLASIYLEQRKIGKSLEILQLAFTQGLLLKESELLQYVYALYEKGLPYKAAGVLSETLQRSQVKSNYKNSALLAALYVDAREEDLALQAFEVAAQYAEDGKDDLYIAQIHFDKESFRKAITRASTALNKGVKNPGNAYMLIAAAHHELEEIDKTKTNLKKATKYKKTRKSAQQWLEGLETDTIRIPQ